MGMLETIYNHVPISFQNLMCTISGYQRNYTRYGKAYTEYRDFLEEYDKKTINEQQQFQTRLFKEFVGFAVNNSRFYHGLYRNIDLENTNRDQLPVLNKESLRTRISEIVTVSKNKAIVGHTGGTTGKAITVYTTKTDFEHRMAMLDHFKSRVGFENRKMKRATFNAQHIVPVGQKKPVFWRYNHACKQMIYSAFHVSPQNIPYYIESLNKYKPIAIDGYPSCIYAIADYIERNKVKLEFTPNYVFTTSETLYQEMREVIERVFRCEIFDQYASSEGAPFVTECKYHTLHVETASGIIDQGEDGSSLVTCFYTHGTPLIRYDIGDKIVLNPLKKCRCGRGQVVERIEGRASDYLIGANGAKIYAVNVANITKDLGNSVIQAQYIQENYDEIVIKLQVDKEKYSSVDEDKLKKMCLSRLGKGIDVSIRLVDEIPKEKSGKTRLIRNTLI